ncbi:MAG TPA: hypothetical protein VEY90_07225, partial [Thermoleophilaceae bacterium]|nr:hypothetical protein [Thermoleophilaceae bacterium]
MACAATLLVPAPPAWGAIYVVKQCNPATTYEHDWFAPTTRGDVLWGEARCNDNSMHLHALSFRRIGLNEGIAWVTFAPEGTSFTHWSAGFMGSANSADGILHRARVCWDYFCQSSGPFLLLGLHSPSTPIERRWDGIGAMALRVEMDCGAFAGEDGCAWTLFYPTISMHNQEIGLNDAHPPGAPTITGGTLPTGTWTRTGGTVSYTASDVGGGVASTELQIDGRALGSHSTCPGPLHLEGKLVWRRLRPCAPSTSGTIQAALTVPDGAHQATVVARDPAGQATASAPFTVRVDNTPPAPPGSIAVAGGDGWRNVNRFDLSWENPIERHAPIAAAGWRLCPVAGGQCTSGRVNGRDVHELAGLAPGASGEYDLSIWLADEAGNEDSTQPRTVRLRLDTEAPAPVFEAHDPADPQRISVLAPDAHSGLAGGEIEMRAAGGTTWHTLSTV